MLPGVRRFFNVAGPCDPERHYMIPAAERLPAARTIIDQGGYFVVHAPRQTGKTTTLRALAKQLTSEGKYTALHFTCEEGEPAGDEVEQAQLAVLHAIRRQASIDLPPELRPPEPFPTAAPLSMLSAALTAWAQACPRPLVLFFDEIDALRGESLRAVLRQLRAGYANRPRAFASSVVLCGLRDVRDYKAASGGDPDRLGTSSPFNIKLKSLRIGDFNQSEVCQLYAQHTADTGQLFTEEALSRAWELTVGQPWLVNALGREVVEEIAVPVSEAIAGAHVEEAKERLILARATHLDSLAHKLREPRVRRVIEPVLAGAYQGGDDAYEDDLSYVRDLGLIAANNPVRIANPIYREVIARVLASPAEAQLPAPAPGAYLLTDGRLAFRRLLRSFAAFWREHGEVLASGMPYAEVAPPLVFMAFLQRVVNGGGFIDREYGIGRGRLDVLVRFPYKKPDGSRAVQRRAIEMKVWRRGQKSPLKQGLAQMDEYLARLRLRRGTLVIFDARTGLARRTPRFEETTTPEGRSVTVLWA